MHRNGGNLSKIPLLCLGVNDSQTLSNVPFILVLNVTNKSMSKGQNSVRSLAMITTKIKVIHWLRPHPLEKSCSEDWTVLTLAVVPSQIILGYIRGT